MHIFPVFSTNVTRVLFLRTVIASIYQVAIPLGTFNRVQVDEFLLRFHYTFNRLLFACFVQSNEFFLDLNNSLLNRCFIQNGEIKISQRCIIHLCINKVSILGSYFSYFCNYQVIDYIFFFRNKFFYYFFILVQSFIILIF